MPALDESNDDSILRILRDRKEVPLSKTGYEDAPR